MPEGIEQVIFPQGVFEFGGQWDLAGTGIRRQLNFYRVSIAGAGGFSHLGIDEEAMPAAFARNKIRAKGMAIDRARHRDNPNMV